MDLVVFWNSLRVGNRHGPCVPIPGVERRESTYLSYISYVVKQEKFELEKGRKNVG
jgi:hypothetical protein